MKKMLMRLITKMQKKLVVKRSDFAINAYYFLARLHFRLHFGKSLADCLTRKSPEGEMAARRHGRIVLKVMFPNATSIGKKLIFSAAQRSFNLNVIVG